MTVSPNQGWLPVDAIGAVHPRKPFARPSQGKEAEINAQPHTIT